CANPHDRTNSSSLQVRQARDPLKMPSEFAKSPGQRERDPSQKLVLTRHALLERFAVTSLSETQSSEAPITADHFCASPQAPLRWPRSSVLINFLQPRPFPSWILRHSRTRRVAIHIRWLAGTPISLVWRASSPTWRWLCGFLGAERPDERKSQACRSDG